MSERKKGTVNGKSFESGREMVALIYRLFYNSHPSITLREFMDELSAYRVWPFNDANQRSFFKSEGEYNKLSPDLQKKYYDKTPFMMDGQNYYLKTETGEPETSEHIRFAEDHGINVVVYTEPNMGGSTSSSPVAGKFRSKQYSCRYELGNTPFTAQLRNICPEDCDLDLLDDREPDGPHNVKYAPGVSNGEKIPGLRSFIAREMEIINRAFCDELHTNGLIVDSLRVILSPKKIVKEYWEPIDQMDLRNLIEQYRKVGISGVPSVDIDKLLSDNTVTDIIAGEYLGYKDDRQIINIYYRVLDASNTAGYFANVRKVLSHEMLHALHHRMAPDTFYTATQKAERVREALADFFCFAYCLDDGTCIWGADITRSSKETSQNTYNRWKQRFHTVWPYAYALYFMIINNNEMAFSTNIIDYKRYGCKEKWLETFSISRLNMSEAYSFLLK